MTRLLHFPARPTLAELLATERQLLADLEEVRAEIGRAELPLAPGWPEKPRGARLGHSPSPTEQNGRDRQ